MQTKLCIHDPPSFILYRKCLLATIERYYLKINRFKFKNISGSTNYITESFIYFWRVSSLYKVSSENYLDICPLFCFPVWRMNVNSDSRYGILLDCRILSAHWRRNRARQKTGSLWLKFQDPALSWEALVFIKENQIPHFSLQWRWIQYFPHSFHQIDRLRVNFVLARPRGSEAQRYGAGSIYQQIRCTLAATPWACAVPAAALTLSTEMVLQQGLKRAHAPLPGLRLSLPSLSVLDNTDSMLLWTHMFRVILSKPLWSTATCSAHFQASQMLNATQKSLARFWLEPPFPGTRIRKPHQNEYVL